MCWYYYMDDGVFDVAWIFFSMEYKIHKKIEIAIHPRRKSTEFIERTLKVLGRDSTENFHVPYGMQNFCTNIFTYLKLIMYLSFTNFQPSVARMSSN